MKAVCGVVFSVVACSGSGCSVRPQADFDRTAALVEHQTGTPESYDPEIDQLIDEKVGALLDAGLTVEESVRVALLKNPDFQSQFQAIGASRADVVQSGLLSNPTLGFAVLFPEGGGRSKLTLGLAQEIVDFWQIPVRKQVAENELERMVFSVVQRGVEIAGRARADAYRVLALERARQIAQENATIVQRSLTISEKRVQSGETSELDANLVRATLTQTTLELWDVEREEQVARSQFAQSLGLSRWLRSWTLDDALPRYSIEIPDDPDLMVWGLSERMDVKAKARQVDAAVAELKRQYLNVFPSIQLGVEAERPDTRGIPGRSVLADTARASVAAGQPTAPDIQSRGERDQMRRQIIDSIVGPAITITLPVFDQNQAQIARARYVIEQRRKEYEALLDAVAQQIQESAAIARIAARQLGYYEQEVLPLARSNLDATERAYLAGERDEVFVLQAQQFLVNRRRAYVDVLRQHAVALAVLEQAVGGRMPVPATQPVTTRPANPD